MVIDDEAEIGGLFKRTLPDYNIRHVQSGEESLERIKEEVPDIVLLDLFLPDMPGTGVLRKIKEIYPDAIIIIMTGHAGIESAVETMKLGAYDYLPKPLPLHRLKIIVDNAMKVRILDREIKELKKDISMAFSIDQIVTVNKKMQDILSLVRKAATHDITVLISGESGTGKEMIAKAIHYESRRRQGPFIAVDCATLSETLIESELFGHEKGAFTGADKERPGKFELADHGTIFLDEIGNLSDNTQIKLLRVLQERELVKVGGKRTIPVDVRVITATNRDLLDLVKKKRFRDDLYYRINVFPIRLPALKERRDDIAPLSKYFLERFNKEFNRALAGISPEAVSVLNRYSWTGNVRELENTIRSAVILADDWIRPEHLVNLADISKESVCVDSSGSLKEITKKAEKEMIERVLGEERYNKRRAAEKLGVDYKTLYNKMKEYNIK